MLLMRALAHAKNVRGPSTPWCDKIGAASVLESQPNWSNRAKAPKRLPGREPLRGLGTVNEDWSSGDGLGYRGYRLD
jgi:hypothetical protein